MKESRLRVLDNQIRRLERRLAALERVSDRYSWLRVGAVLLGLAATGLVLYFLGAWPAAAAAALGLAAFGATVYGHRRVQRAMACHRLWQRNKTAQVARATLDWERIPAGATFRPRPEHPFEADLDLVGPRSLHLLLDTAATYEGSRRLRDLLAGPAPDRAQALARQHLVHELAPMHAFRDRLRLNGLAAPAAGGTGAGLWAGWKAAPLAEWLARRPPEAVAGAPGREAPAWRWLALFAGLVAVNLLLLAGDLLGLLPPVWQLTAVLYLGLWWYRARATAAAWAETLSLHGALERLRAVFAHLEAFSYADKPHLRALCAPFLDPRQRPSRHLAALNRLVAAMGLRQNPVLGLVLNLLLPWDAFLTYRLGRTWAAVSDRAPGWLETWFELEALSSLAGFAYLNPGYAFPGIDGAEQGPVLEATALGHPLIPEAQRVSNDFTIPHLGWVAIITGSNMAGKSVFLKTVGANLALAYAGGPVSARALRSRPLRLFCSMEVSDSVTDGISYFYAEVKRLKALLAALEGADSLPLLFFIDEIFRGTNNRERLLGSRAYVRALVGRRGAGLIATHDLELAKLAGEIRAGGEYRSAVENYHFRDRVVAGRQVAQLAFDYVLRPGPCPTTNALKIMALEGLPVPPEAWI